VGLLAVALALLQGAGALAVTVSSDQAGASGVATMLRLRTELQCGTASGPPLVVVFPAAERVPRRLSPGAVRVNGRPVEAATVTGGRVSVRVARPQVICDVIAPGTITIVFTRAAGLGNPPRPGSYAVSVRRGRRTFVGTLTIER
jgi:hypothetical protein